ncbi:acyl-CoA dehydrogenase family protein [Finegoldia magna]|uniref:acyl-CoA dehydrogenase family protein n=2 Tax=Finegoldia magna TaxID=1260 RepID=UPI002904DE7A|nr:acyl-CoA dehydrogenase family protein [Finegoldia magna]MDU1214252.1 acyl-CoA dehydrogenase family protein [Finegoldia magna]MDU5186668.1 acyl-CoA dehydrogenase family protein [Finegoldia magna]MDU5441848.1 acyl-CoA dehydrogenase family protein [Finegoldia magna]MDU7032740.1 acyl-CoA dehydrogenase family protein [Finegoldia magna]MDU7140196.1 acyl-CoA dehydrogenase family protein [Finegoldia magna]
MGIYEQAKEFAKKYLEEEGKKSDKDCTFPKEAFEKMGEEGFLKLLIPEEMGGLGKGAKEHQEVTMAFAEYNPSAALCYMMHNVGISGVLDYGQKTLIDKIVKDVVENNKFMALADSEFGSGTHFGNPEMTCTKNGDEYVFKGTKSMVTSATYASYYQYNSKSAEFEGKTTYWVVPLESEGLSFNMKYWDGVGMRGNVSCPMKFDNVKLKSDYRLGEEGGADEVASVVTKMFLLGLASVYAGLNIRISNITNRYATSRKYPNGKCLADIEIVQMYLSKIYSMAQSARTLSEDAAEAIVNNSEDMLKKIIAARVTSIENSMNSATLAMRIGGGITYNKKTEIEKLMRDAYAGQIMAPSLDVLHVMLGGILATENK